MSGEAFLERLLNIYRSSYDLQAPFDLEGSRYDAYGFCKVTNAKYVLVKKAELWQTICYEHAFFKVLHDFSLAELDSFLRQVQDQIEPQMVRKGQASMEKNHMYSDITGIFVCEQPLDREIQRKIRSARFYKSYQFSFRGYCQLRLLAVDLQDRQLVCNDAARALKKEYKKLLASI